MNTYIKNTLIGGVLVSIAILMFYFGFLSNFLLLQNGEIDSFRFDIRALMSPFVFFAGFFLITLQPKSNVFGPWNTLDKEGKKYLLFVTIIGLISSTLLFIWVTINNDAYGTKYPDNQNYMNTEDTKK